MQSLYARIAATTHKISNYERDRMAELERDLTADLDELVNDFKVRELDLKIEAMKGVIELICDPV